MYKSILKIGLVIITLLGIGAYFLVEAISGEYIAKELEGRKRLGNSIVEFNEVKVNGLNSIQTKETNLLIPTKSFNIPLSLQNTKSGFSILSLLLGQISIPFDAAAYQGNISGRVETSMFLSKNKNIQDNHEKMEKVHKDD